MKNKLITADCNSCESTFVVEFVEELSPKTLPEYCVFCGEPIEDIVEEFLDDEDDENTGFEDEKWE